MVLATPRNEMGTPISRRADDSGSDDDEVIIHESDDGGSDDDEVIRASGLRPQSRAELEVEALQMRRCK